MSYKIAVASGKGGTGKTTIAVNLFHLFSKNLNRHVQLVDCDVEEPNDTIFFPGARKLEEKEMCQLVPGIDEDVCSYCGICAEYCEFNAIVIIPSARFVEIDTSLCHSCGACLVACPENAIREYPKPIGKISFFDIYNGNGLTEGRLALGSIMHPLLIRGLKNSISEKKEIVIYDAPPGTGCSVVETLLDVDYVILVTEPTPFGLHDLILMVELLQNIQKPFGVILNKVGLGDAGIYEYLEANCIDLIGEIPFNRKFAGCYSNGDLLDMIPSCIKVCFTQITHSLETKILAYEGDNNFKW